MSENVRLDWRGDQVRDQLAKATLEGIDETTDDCVEDAKSSHTWQNITGAAEASIQKKPATMTATKIAGRWGGAYGGRKARHFFYLEVGTTHMAARPVLQAVSDRQYPKLVGRIAAKANVS